MAVQNLVSASLSPEAKAAVHKGLEELKARLAFLTGITSADLRFVIRPGNNYAPLLDKAIDVVEEHPEILPPVFDAAEFRRDYRLYKDLAPIASQVEELAEGIKNTLAALASDTMVQTLEVYSAVKQNSNKVAGLGAVAEDMGSFFAKRRSRSQKRA